MKTKAMTAALAVCVLLVPALPAVAQWIGFNPAETVPTNETFTVDLVLDTEGVTVMGADVLFSFDPTVVHLDSVTAGDWFTTAPGPHFFWADPALAVPGVVHASGTVMTTGRSGAGVLAVLHFTAVAAGFSPLAFQAVSLRNPLNAPVPHTRSSGDRIIIEEAIPVAGTSFGDLKARWR